MVTVDGNVTVMGPTLILRYTRAVPHTALSCTCTASTCTLALHAPHLLTPLCTTHGTLLHPHAPRCTLPHCTLALHVRHPLSSHTVVYHTRHFPAPARTAPPYHTSCGPPAHSSSPTRLHMPRTPRHPSTNLRPHPTSYDRTLHDPHPLPPLCTITSLFHRDMTHLHGPHQNCPQTS
jgi:hypothetical protein